MVNYTVTRCAVVSDAETNTLACAPAIDDAACDSNARRQGRRQALDARRGRQLTRRVFDDASARCQSRNDPRNVRRARPTRPPRAPSSTFHPRRCSRIHARPRTVTTCACRVADLNIDVASFMWLVGLLEGEGCFTAGAGWPKIALQMTDRDVVARAAKLFGCGVSTKAPSKSATNAPRKTVYATVISGAAAIDWMRALRPYMGERRQARINEHVAAWFARIHTARRDLDRRVHAFLATLPPEQQAAVLTPRAVARALGVPSSGVRALLIGMNIPLVDIDRGRGATNWISSRSGLRVLRRTRVRTTRLWDQPRPCTPTATNERTASYARGAQRSCVAFNADGWCER